MFFIRRLGSSYFSALRQFYPTFHYFRFLTIEQDKPFTLIKVGIVFAKKKKKFSAIINQFGPKIEERKSRKDKERKSSISKYADPT